MEIVPFDNLHIAGFLDTAMQEGWITDRQELEFILKSYSEGCLVFFCAGQPAGFITAIRYVKSAWIGNLLVLPAYRKRGIGRALIEKVLHGLDSDACETVWLTASADGAHLYRSLGFTEIDRVERWRGATRLRLPEDRALQTNSVAAVDAIGWGDHRPAIYESLQKSRAVFAGKASFLAWSAAADLRHIGPWGACCREAAADLLAATIRVDGDEINTVLDVPATNIYAGELLQLKGFIISGATQLMYRGRTPDYRAEHVYALASLGSFG
jgi:ribosomal protein S18 acetylase RimI-like enzyme